MALIVKKKFVIQAICYATFDLDIELFVCCRSHNYFLQHFIVSALNLMLCCPTSLKLLQAIIS